MGDQVRVEAYVSGDVQGVGFRAWTHDRMSQLGLTGSARNLRDGRVEVVANGSRARCEELVRALRGAGTPGRVDEVQASYT